MHTFKTLKPGDNIPELTSQDVAIFTSADFNTPHKEFGIPPPAFIAGGFPFPNYWQGDLFIFRSVYIFPPVGGHVEVSGRVPYINGCSSSLLIMPPRLGAPCLNHLHLIPNCVQDAHRHPGDRIGFVVRGHGGKAHFGKGGVIDLQPGVAWKLPAGEIHNFETGPEALDIVVFHPRSSWGPTEESNQMLDETEKV